MDIQNVTYFKKIRYTVIIDIRLRSKLSKPSWSGKCTLKIEPSMGVINFTINLTILWLENEERKKIKKNITKEIK